MNQKHLIVLTVPHAKCQRESFGMEHTCDYSAEPFARALEKNLDSKKLNTVIYVGQINRYYGKCDLNRRACRGEDFRGALSRKLNARTGKNIFVVDCHSFPPSYSEWSAYEIVFLTFKNQPLIAQPSRALHEALVLRGVKSGLKEGSYANDIILESSEKGAKAVLVEINEGVEMNKPQRLKFITNVMSDKIKELMLS